MDPETINTIEHVPHGSTDDQSLLDFSANINPHVPAGVEEVYTGALEKARRYPPEPPTEFLEAASSAVGCQRNQIIPTPGGLAMLRLAIEVTVQHGDSVLVPTPSFSEYQREVRLQGAYPECVPYNDILSTDPSGHQLAIVCNPNNPTGTLYPHSELREFAVRCQEAETPLLLDEAFLDFTNEPSLAGMENVIVARSLTKVFGLPGIRMGYGVASGRVLEALQAARRPWNMSWPALAVATHCLGQQNFISKTRERTTIERRYLENALSDSFSIFDSAAPFLLLHVGDRSVPDICTTAATEGIALRDATTFRGLDSHIRVAVRTREENDKLLSVLSNV